MKRTALALLALLSAPGLRAQTNDHVWRSWSWQEDVADPRSAGLGGASVALADDSGALIHNPAGLARLPKTEIAAGILSRGGGSLRLGDRTASRAGGGFIGGAGKIATHIAVGAFVMEPHDQRITLSGADSAGGLDTGYLETTVTDAGAAIAWNPSRRVYLGARVNVTHLRLQALLDHGGAVGESYRSGAAASQNRIAGDAGALVELSDQVALGVAFTQGARWNVDRTAAAESGAAVPAFPYQVSSPSRFAAGLCYRPSRRLTLVGQADYVLLSRLKDTFQAVTPAGSRSDYAIDNGFDIRAGAELSIPVSAASVQLRAGIYSQTAGSFRYTGPSGSEGAQFAGVPRRTLATAGGSVVFDVLRVHVAATIGGERTVVAAGAAVRF